MMFKFKLGRNRFGKPTGTPRRRAKRKLGYDLLQERALLATFSGTDGEDLVFVRFEDGRPATIVINGEEFSNPDPTLHISLLGAPGGEFLAEGFDTLDFSGQDFDIQLSNDISSVNQGAVTFDYESNLSLRTDEGDDVIEEDGTLDRVVLVSTFGGDDTFIHNGSGFQTTISGSLSVALGEGDDRLITNKEDTATFGAGFDHFGGEGFDVWESRRVDQGSVIRDFDGFERFIAPDPGLNIGDVVNQARIANSHTGFHNGNSTILFSTRNGTTTRAEFVNFNSFFGNRSSGGSFTVNSLDTSLTLEGFGDVSLGNEDSGDLSQIKGQVYIRGASVLRVNGQGNTSDQNVFVSRQATPEIPENTNLILGLTPKALFVRSASHTVLNGGQGSDRFFVRSVIGTELFLNGNEGDDRFIVGAGTQDISTIALVVANGGNGNDIVRIDDTRSDFNRHYRLRDGWVQKASSSPASSETDFFRGVAFDQVQRVDVDINEFSERVIVSPAAESRFILSGGIPGQTFTDIYQLIPPYGESKFLIDRADGTFVYVFADGEFEFVFVRYQ